MLLSGAMICLFSLTSHELTASTIPLSYAVTYIAAHYLSTDGYDAGGGRTNNAWFLWLVLHLMTTVIAYILDGMFHVKHKEEANE